ncbi:hypothetical protein VST7929_02496 [Vibrio stylophorae]|uniref:DUF3187 family protein n=1 Tax=Vibrio stylophorae TaxID=659351 RepID=A0ABM8ZW75_9VIBR|nr:DUF3187 family protein [Vibrio stylophorae]CAH0534552.1 hypothetical protein VST7929_02496 [Vibrio stylophorae]
MGLLLISKPIALQSISRWCLLFFFLFSSQATWGYANQTNSEFGPLFAPSQSPLQAASLTPMLQDAIWQAGDSEVQASATAASIWGITNELFLDYYHNELRFNYQHAPSKQWRWSMDYRYRFSANNHIDTLTIKFHDAFDIGQNGRDTVPKHQATFRAPSEGLDQSGDSTLSFGHRLTLQLDHAIWSNPYHALSASGALLYSYQPNGPFAHHNFEQSLQLNYRYAPSPKHRWYGMVGVTHRQQTEVLQIRAKAVNSHIALGYLYRWQHNHHLWAQAQVSEGIATHVFSLNKPVYETMLGYRYLYSPRQAIEMVILENWVYYDNSADVAFTLSYRQKF